MGGFSAGKYVTDNFRLELEATRRSGYDYDSTVFLTQAHVDDNIVQTNYNAKLNTRSLFINGFYDFRSFSLGYTSIKPYLAGGIGVSRNKMDDV